MDPYPSEPDLVVLHALRCIGAASAARLAEAVQQDTLDTESELIDLARAGLVSYLRGPFAGWAITEQGRAADARRIARELDDSGHREAVQSSFDSFLVLNPEVLDVCTAWQLRTPGGTPNDHADGTYDARVLRRLHVLDRRAQALCDELTGSLARFEPYGNRLATALERAMAGDTGYVTDTTGSYHTVWFQLHEDLLVTLGTSRW